MSEADNQLDGKNCQFSVASTVESDNLPKMNGKEVKEEEEEDDQFADTIGVDDEFPQDGPFQRGARLSVPMVHNPDGALSEDEVKLALDNVNVLFGAAGLEDQFEEAEEDPSYYIHARESRMDSVAKARRNRVDSTARPAEFFKPPTKGAFSKLPSTLGPQQRTQQNQINFLDFSTHGICAPALRERLESKAIDQQALKRVENDFTLHDKLSKSDFDSLQEEVDMAQNLHRKNDLNGAKKLYTKVLEKDPLDWDCLCNLAKIHFGMGEYASAKDLFERAIVIRPEREKTMYYLAHVLFNLQDFERAKLLFEQVVQGYKGELNGEACDKGTYHNSIAMLGLVHQKAFKNYEKADKLYQVVLAEEPEHILSLDHRCAMLAMQGKMDEAAKLHAHVVALDPGHTKKVCAYLDALFPSDSEMIHQYKALDQKFQACEHVFADGVRKKSWIRNAVHSLRKKMMRAVSKSK